MSSPPGPEGPPVGGKRCKSCSRLRVVNGAEFISMTTHVKVPVVRMSGDPRKCGLQLKPEFAIDAALIAPESS